MRKVTKIIMTLLVIVIILLISFYFTKFTNFSNLKKPISGNTTGNINNSGFLAIQDGWIYYNYAKRFSWWGIEKYQLCKVKTDGTEKTVLLDTYCSYINVVKEWIYFYDGQNYCKVTTEGKNKSRVFNGNGSQNTAYGFTIYGDWIYFTRIVETPPSSDINIFHLFRIKTDGTEKALLSPDNIEYFDIGQDWIYFANKSDDYKLYKMQIDGTNRHKVSDVIVNEINLDGSWIYFTNGTNWYDTRLMRIRTNGKENMQLGKVSSKEKEEIESDIASDINVSNGWIYYSNLSDDDKLYKICCDGSQKTKLSDDVPSFIQVTNGWVYFFVSDEDMQFFKIRTDGTGRQMVDPIPPKGEYPGRGE